MDNNDNKPDLGESTNGSGDDGEQIKVNVGKSSQDIINESDKKSDTDEKPDTPKEENTDSVEDKPAEDTGDDIKIENDKLVTPPADDDKPKEDEQAVDEVHTTTTITTTKPAEEPKAPVVDTAKEMPKHQPVPTGAGLPQDVTKLQKRNKHLKVWLVVLIVLLVAVASALVMYFFNQSKANSDLDAANAKNAQLQQDLVTQQQTATQKTIDELNVEITEQKTANTKLAEEITAQQTTITELNDAIKELQKICGTACDSVVIPEVSSQNPDTTPPESNQSGQQ